MSELTAAPAASRIVPTPLVRKFRMGATVLDDVNPDWTPEQVLAAFAPNYPFLAQSSLAEPVVENGFLVFAIIKPAVQTKGADDPLADIERQITAWADTAIPRPDAFEPWKPVLALIDRRLSEPGRAHGLLDPLFIPLA